MPQLRSRFSHSGTCMTASRGSKGTLSYIQPQRLTGVRRELRRADPSKTRVADVANDWGFWHMGQFAADYRRHFGELPSATFGRRAGVRTSKR